MAPPLHGLLDAICPVDFTHPLNSRLLGDWSVSPLAGWRYGLTLRNLARGARSSDGTLTNGPKWSGGQQPGGHGSLLFAGASSQDVIGNTVNSFNMGASSWTVAAWLRPTAFGSGTLPQVLGKGTSFSTIAGLFTSDASGNQIQCRNNGFTGADATADGGLNSLVLNSWHFYAGTYTLATLKTAVYRDGVSLATSTAATGTGPALGATNLQIGGNAGTSLGFITGLADGFLLFARALSPTEVMDLFLETRAGNPNRWRWLSPTAYSFPAAGAAADPFPAWQARRLLYEEIDEEFTY